MISYEVWRGWFAGAEPIGYRLRDVLPGRWVRFHNLPDEQRYPQTEADFTTLLHRHNTVMNSLIGPGGTILLLTTGYSDSETPMGRDEVFEAFDPGAAHWRTINMELIDPVWFGGYRHVYASERSWQPGLLDPLIRLSAVDQDTNVLLLDPDCRWAIAPYGGGMDVILDRSTSRDRLKAQIPDWLP